MATSTSAFLQAHARRLYVRSGTANRLLFGTKVGAWRVRSRCRDESNCATYAVVAEPGGEHAALTVIDTPALALGSYTRRILATAQTLTTIEHPGVISIVDAGLVADGRPYFVTELCEGVTLADRMRDGSELDRATALTILGGICAALMAAHEAGVVHGSLDLDHVLLVSSDAAFVKLLDWGVARVVSDEARRAGVELDPSGSCVAPEQLVGILSPQTDIYAVGVIAHHLLFGRAPEQLRIDDAQAEVVMPRELWPAIPSSLETLMGELLAPDPRRRPTIGDAAERFARVARELTTPPTVQTSSSPEASSTSEEFDDVTTDSYAPGLFRRWATAAVIGVIAAVATIVVVATHEADVGTAQASLSPTPAPRPAHVVTTVKPSPVPAASPPAATLPPIVPPIAPAVILPPASAATVIPARRPPATPVSPPVVAAKPAAPRGPVKAPTTLEKVDANEPLTSELLTQYQRIGHDLIELRQQRGTAAIADLWQEFDGLQIHHALATAKTRAAAAATLGELRAKIERNKGVKVSAACLENPLAEGCR